jgi:hypothetical protein
MTDPDPRLERLNDLVARRAERAAACPPSEDLTLDELLGGETQRPTPAPAASYRVGSWHEDDPCQVCDEEGTDDDPIAHHVAPGDPGYYVMAHGQCGLDAGLTLA